MLNQAKHYRQLWLELFLDPQFLSLVMLVVVEEVAVFLLYLNTYNLKISKKLLYYIKVIEITSFNKKGLIINSKG